MEQFTFSFESLIRFLRRQQRSDYEAIDLILDAYDKTTLIGMRRQYAITAILMELGLHPVENDNEEISEVELDEPVEENRTFSIEGSYQIMVCEVMNHYVAFNVFLN